MSPLAAMLDEIRTSPKHKPENAHHLEAVAGLFEVLQNSEAAIELYDRACEIAGRKSIPLGERLLALHLYLVAAPLLQQAIGRADPPARGRLQ